MGGGPPPRRRMPTGIGKVTKGRDDCDLAFTIDLVGVRRDATRGIRPGDVLEVRIQEQAGTSAAVCETADGKVVGALSGFRGLATLLDCLDGGTEYEAVVEAVGPTRCTVSVSRVSS